MVSRVTEIVQPSTKTSGKKYNDTLEKNTHEHIRKDLIIMKLGFSFVMNVFILIIILLLPVDIYVVLVAEAKTPQQT